MKIRSMTLFPLDWKGLFEMKASGPLAPGLYVVATPIGNLGDLTARAADVLCRADLILAEDTRVTGKLLAHIGSKVPTRRHDDHSSDEERMRVITMMGEKAVALVSDAGTPLISDPGYRLVRDARVEGVAIHTLPGPCAGIAALTLAGLPTDRFLFLGFLPTKAKARADAIAEVARLRATLLIYESGSRLGATLEALSHALGEREAAVIREISKLFEECMAGRLKDLAERYADAPPKGEIVIVVGPPAEAAEVSDSDVDLALDNYFEKRFSPSRAAAQVAEELGIPRKRAYARALDRSK